MKGELKIKRIKTASGQATTIRKWKPKYVVLEAGLMNIYKDSKDLSDVEVSFEVKQICQLALIGTTELKIRLNDESVIKLVSNDFLKSYVL